MKITIVIFYNGSDKDIFENISIPSMARYFDIDCVTKIIIICKYKTPYICDEKISKLVQFVDYKHITHVHSKIQTNVLLYLNQRFCFIKPCFLNDLIKNNKCLSSKDANNLFYKNHLLNNYFPVNEDDYYKNLKVKNLYNTLYIASNDYYVSTNQTNSLYNSFNNNNSFLITLNSYADQRIAKNWLQPQKMAGIEICTPEVCPVSKARKLLQTEKFWMVSTGGVASNYIYKLLGQPMNLKTYQLICHYPHPIITGNSKLKALFLFDDIYHAVISQFNRNFQVANIRKISNRNYNSVYVSNLNLKNYSNLGRDLMEVEKQFDSWTNPKNVDFEICCCRSSKISEHLDELLAWLNITGKEKDHIKNKCNMKPFNKPNVPENLKKIYKNLDEKIKKHPDFIIHKIKL